MARKHQAGCGCCGGCASTKTFYDPGDWTAGVGGTVTDGTASNAVDLDGPVDPSSFQSTEAWLIKFDIESGSVTFTIDSIDYVINAGTQTLSVDGTSVAFGYSTITSKMSYVELRVTPSHAFLLVFGNYSPYYGILTIDRSTASPSSFSAVWSNATVVDFEISDATVEVDSDGTYGPIFSTRCWSRADVSGCPYVVVEDVTNSHQYYGTTNVVQESTSDANIRSISGDVDMGDVSLSTGGGAWFDGSDGFTYTGSAFWAWRSSAAIGDTRLSAPSAGTLDYRTGETACNPLSEIACWRESAVADWDYETLHINFNLFASSLCSRSLTLTFPDETVATPYPKPYLYAAVSMTYTRSDYESGGATNSDIAVNDISAGFSLVVVGTENRASANSYEFIVGGTWTVL